MSGVKRASLKAVTMRLAKSAAMGEEVEGGEGRLRSEAKREDVSKSEAKGSNEPSSPIKNKVTKRLEGPNCVAPSGTPQKFKMGFNLDI